MESVLITPPLRQLIATGADAEAVNAIYASRHMVQVPPDFFWSRRDDRTLTVMVAEDAKSRQIIGTVMGIARLSHNWIVNKIATVYIETIRNIPVLVQIIFWLAVVQIFPALEADDVGEYWFLATAKGVSVPWFFPGDGFYQWLVFLVIAAVMVGECARSDSSPTSPT